MQECSELVEKAMTKFLPVDFSDSKIVEAMRYSSLGGGKKIRPFLLISCAEIFGVARQSCLNLACALEFSHVFSLIHDDLPAMDNDDYRRGKLSNHKQFNEATAILAGDALLALSFEILTTDNSHSSEIRCELLKILSSAIGYEGMIGGQMMDIENVNKKMDLQQVFKLHHLKTGRLFIASAEFGAVIGNASKIEREAIIAFAKNLGLAFQIKDDILDHLEGDAKISDPTSIINIVGIDKAHDILKELQFKTKQDLSIFDKKAKTLLEIMDFVINRNK